MSQVQGTPLGTAKGPSEPESSKPRAHMHGRGLPISVQPPGSLKNENSFLSFGF